MKRASRPKAAWPAGGSVIPQWLFWALTVAVALVCGLAIGLLGDNTVGDSPRPADPAEQPAAAPSDDESPSPGQESIPSGNAEDNTAAPTSGVVASDASTGDLITDGITVQVLNASGERRADNRVADRLEELGFEIVAVNPAAKVYRETTVFWSKAAGRNASRALADHFSWRARPRPKNLSKSVTTHVVVGRDES